MTHPAWVGLAPAVLFAAAVVVAGPGTRPGARGTPRRWAPRVLWSRWRPGGEGVPGRVAPLDVALLLDLTATGLRAGMPVASAVTVAGSAIGGGLAVAVMRLVQASTVRAQSQPAPGDLRALADALDLGGRTGHASADLLERAALGVRRAAAEQAAVEAARLGVRLLLPLGLCWLPAVVLLGVLPVVLGLTAEVVQSR